VSKPISRVLYLTIIYLGVLSPVRSSDLPTGKRRAAAFQAICHYWQLPPCLVLLRVGFARPVCYHTAGELLPHHFNLTCALRPSAVCFCCTFLEVTFTRRYLAPLPYGARTFLMDVKASTRLSGLLTIVLYHIREWI
jgi:hypothetical protein